MKKNIKEKIQGLIDEGVLLRKTHAKEGVYSGEYLNGAEYEFWVTKCVDLMETYFKKHHLHSKLIDASKKAVGNGTEYYDQINSVLNILLDTEYKADSSAEVENDDFNKFEKIFISHSSKDKEYVGQLIQLLNNIGIVKARKNLFCSSFEGYNIPIGEKIYDYIKSQFNDKTLVIFVLSKNYYNSAACLNEMGATWISSFKHISILHPNFNFNNIEGAIDPTEICFKFDDKERLNSFKDDIINLFELEKIDGSIWERDRDVFLDKINELTVQDKYTTSLTRVDIGRVKRKGNDKLEVDLRFINDSAKPIEFQELSIILTDDSGNKCNIEVKDDILSKYTIYDFENRREVFEFNLPETDYDVRRHRNWKTISRAIPAF